MVLELITAYGIIIGTIVGTGHALHHMYGEPEATSSLETLPVLPSAGMELEENNIMIDTLSGLKEEQFISRSKTLVAGESLKDDGGRETQTDIQAVGETMIKSPVTPVSDEDSVKRTVKTVSGVPKVLQQQPYDIFEAVGFEDDENFESWAK